MNPTRKLIVSDLSEITTGNGQHGQWTLYRVEATDEHGQVIQQRLKTFQALPIGEPIEVEIERQEHERYGESFLLRRPRQNGGALRELRERLEVLERRVEALEGP